MHADSATKRREAADFDRPAPAAAPERRPLANQNRAGQNLRVETLISIWFAGMAHLLLSQFSATRRFPQLRIFRKFSMF